MRQPASTAVLLVALLTAPCARADVDLRLDSGRDQDERIRLRLLGGYRAALHVQSAYPIDPEGNTFEQRLYLDHRMRFAPELTILGRVQLGVELDLLSGLVGGHLPDGSVAFDERLRWDASGLRHAELRQVFLRVLGDQVRLHLGLLTDRWGLGAVAGDGGPAGAGFGDDPFGTDAFGDHMFRIAVEILPTAPGGTLRFVHVQAMLDLVERDEQTRLLGEGDIALAPGIRLVYDTPLARAGAWLSWRTLRHRDGAGAEILLADLFVDRWLPVGRREARLRFAAELAGQAGRSSLDPGWPAESGRPVAAGAAVVAGGVELPGPRLFLGLRAGAVSGDGDPTDGRDTGFRLDRDFNAGLILFDEVLAGVGARTAVQVEELTGEDATALAGEGAIHGAIFALPYLAFRPHPFVDLRVGGLLATAPAGLVTVRGTTGGLEGVSPGSGPPFLGGELDVALTLDLPIVPNNQNRSRFGIRLEYGHLFPGPALTDGWTDPVGGVDLFATRMGLTF